MERQFNDVKINVEFEETQNRQQLTSGDSVNSLFGKIKKWFSDLKPIAFTGKYSDLSEVPEYTPAESGLYKITVDNSGNVSSVTPVTKEDIEELGIVGEYEFEVRDGSLFYGAKQED